MNIVVETKKNIHFLIHPETPGKVQVTIFITDIDITASFITFAKSNFYSIVTFAVENNQMLLNQINQSKMSISLVEKSYRQKQKFNLNATDNLWYCF